MVSYGIGLPFWQHLRELSAATSRQANSCYTIVRLHHTCRASVSRRSEMAIKRHASAEWQGSGKDGKGSLTTQSATLKDTPYSFTARFGDGKGTNPEELIAAAHAGCFSMATAFQLSGAGHPPDSLHTDATLTMEQEGAGWKIAAVHLVLRARVPGIDAAKFQELAAAAKANCPVSKVLNAEIPVGSGRGPKGRPADIRSNKACLHLVDKRPL